MSIFLNNYAFIYDTFVEFSTIVPPGLNLRRGFLFLNFFKKKYFFKDAHNLRTNIKWEKQIHMAWREFEGLQNRVTDHSAQCQKYHKKLNLKSLSRDFSATLYFRLFLPKNFNF